jgi:hypothetical protein
MRAPCSAAILLPMQIDPVEEWRRLTEHYRQMSDVQLQELALDFADLTEMAQQSLRGELGHRGLDLAQSANREPAAQVNPPMRESAPAADADDADNDAPHEYTWKTLLCECSDRQHAWQIGEVLRRAGIESWMEGPGIYSPYADLDMTSPRILVAADQLNEARLIAERPIPQNVIDESKETPPDFEPPVCPSCRAQDPILEATDPVNTWRCEACGRQWSDPVPAADGEPQKAGF